ncbi:unnamed protein product [Ambrosiozyma monospora]|uniref:Unnamed protein product n=1 Tax=Ambrosiozyma monospora TaxID=43982 RepID=A0ACB5TPK8_AMBMO|nr:unnamed protein product [Ambrosiozyma monospora]
MMNIVGYFLDNFIAHLFLSFISVCAFVTATVHAIFSLNNVLQKDWICWISILTLLASLAASLMNVLRLKKAHIYCLQGIRNPARLKIIDFIKTTPSFSQLIKKLIIYIQAICWIVLFVNIVVDAYENFRTISISALIYIKLSIISTFLTKIIKHPALEVYSLFLLFASLALTTTYMGLLIRQTVEYSETFLIWESDAFRACKWSLVPVSFLEFTTFILQFCIVEVSLQDYYLPDDHSNSHPQERVEKLTGKSGNYQAVNTTDQLV